MSIAYDLLMMALNSFKPQADLSIMMGNFNESPTFFLPCRAMSVGTQRKGTSLTGLRILGTRLHEYAYCAV